MNLNMYTLSTPTKTTGKAIASPARIPQFLNPPSSSAAVLYDEQTMSRILEEDQLEAPASLLSPIGHKDLLSTKVILS